MSGGLPISFGIGQGWPLGPGQAKPTVLTLGTLTLSPLAASSGVGYVGTITGKTSGSTITVTSSDGTSLNVTGTTVSGTFVTSGTKTLTITETHPNAANSPRVSLATMTVTAFVPVLASLTMSPLTSTSGVAYSGSITNATAGSTITASSSDGTSLVVSGTGTTRTVTGTFASAGAPTITMTEVLANASNSPRVTTATMAVSSAVPSLSVLSLSPLSATATVAYSGTISNATPGSTIGATSSDGTTLVVSGTGTNRTVTGTFSSAGSPTITMTETLSGSPNSPRVSTSNMTVAPSSVGAPTLTGYAMPGMTVFSDQSGQFKLDGTNVSGATGTAYVCGSADVGKVLSQTTSGGTTTFGAVASHVFYDNFTVASDTALASYATSLGPKFTRSNTADTIVVNVYSATGRAHSSSTTASSQWRLGGLPPAVGTDYKVGATAYWNNPSIGGVFARQSVSSRNGYAFYYQNTTNTWQIVRWGSSGTVQATINTSSVGASAPTAGATQLIELEVSNSGTTVNLVGKVDGVTVCSGSDTTSNILTAGASGILFGRQDFEVSDFKISPLTTIPSNAKGVSIASMDGIWSWYNSPNQVTVNGAVLTGYVSSTGAVKISAMKNGYTWEVDLGLLVDVDDHDDPGIAILPSGRIFVTASKHNGSLNGWTSNTVAPDIGSWTGKYTIQNGSSPDVNSYANVSILSDGFARIIGRQGLGGAATNKQWLYKKSTTEIEAGNNTWVAPTDMLGVTGNRPYPVYSVHPSANRIDVFTSSAHPNEDVANLYHFYIICSGGTETYYKSDGTQITATLPFDPSVHATLVMDNSAGQNWSWDVKRANDGTIYGCSTKYPGFTSAIARNTLLTNIEYWVHRYTVAGGWEHFRVSTGQKSLYAAENCYAGGICCDGNDPTKVFVSEVNGSGFNEPIHYQINWSGAGSGATGKTLIRNLMPGATADYNRPKSSPDYDNTRAVCYWTTDSSIVSGKFYTTWDNYNTAIVSIPADPG